MMCLLRGQREACIYLVCASFARLLVSRVHIVRESASSYHHIFVTVAYLSSEPPPASA